MMFVEILCKWESLYMRKSKKITIAATFSGFVLAALICVPLLKNSEGLLSRVKAGQNDYSLTLDKNNKLTSDEASAGTCVRNTAIGNPITYVLSSTSYTTNVNSFARVNGNGYIRNQTPVNGIYQISITVASGSYNLTFGNVFGTYTVQSDTITLEANQVDTHVFTVSNYSYFSFNNVGSDSIYFRNLTANYSCEAPVVPSGQYVSYTFTGDEELERGYAQGAIIAHNDNNFAVNDEVSFYWGDGTGKFDNYYALGSAVAESATTDLAITIDENVVIPASATKVYAELNGSAFASYDIPSEKRNNESLIHKYATISDVHLNYNNGQKHLEEALNRFEADGVEYVISSGDTGRNASDYAKYEAALQDSNFTGLVFASMGNHDQPVPALFKSHAIYNGATKTFITLDNAPTYFANTYNNPSLPVSVFYNDLEGDGATCYYYATIANNFYFFMDQMLGDESGTATKDNFSANQMALLESAFAEYAGDHAGDVNFAYDKYNLNIIEHAPIEQFRVGDVYPAKYGGAMMISVMYDNINRFVELLKEYPEAMWFSGHTHLFFDVGINYVDNYYDMLNLETSTPLAHSFHVPSVTQPRWYKASGSMAMPNDFSNGSEAYYCYQYNSNLVFEAHRLKEYNESKATYDHADYINKVLGQYSYIVPSETQEHVGPGVTTDYAVAANGVARQGALTFSDTADGLQVNFAAANNRFELKTGNHVDEIGNDYYVSFLFKSNNITSMTIGACNYSGGRYNNFSINLTQSGTNYTIEDAGNGYVKFTMALDTLYNHNCGETFAVRFYDANAAGTFYLKNFYIQPASAPAMTYRGQQFYYQKNFTYETTYAAYTHVEFDYYLIHNGTFNMCIMNEDWGKYYGYYAFNQNGPEGNYDGITSEVLADGYIHVVMATAELGKTNGNNNRNNVPETIGRFYIRGNWSDAVGLVDNIRFYVDESVIIPEVATLTSNLENLSIDYGYSNGTTDAFVHNTVYGATSNTARKLIFAESTISDDQVYCAFSPEADHLNGMDATNSTLTFDIMLSDEFYQSENIYKHMFSLNLISSNWQANSEWLNYDPRGSAGFGPSYTDNGWYHITVNIPQVYSNNTLLANDLIRIRFGFFGLTDQTKANAYVIIDNMTLTANN